MNCQLCIYFNCFPFQILIIHCLCVGVRTVHTFPHVLMGLDGLYAGIILRIMVAKRIENYSGIIGGNLSLTIHNMALIY